MLDAIEIKKYITTNYLQDQLKIEVFTTIDSTNQYLRSVRHHAEKQWMVCLAEAQTAGRGRLGRTWYSPFGVNLYFSLLWITSKEINQLTGLSLVTGLAVVKALNLCGIKNSLKLKWPNDVLWEGKKLAGILLEINSSTTKSSEVIIGIGLNVNMPTGQLHPIDQPWATMESILAKRQDRNFIAAQLIEVLISYLDRFDAAGFTDFSAEWHDYDALYGQTIHLEHQASLLKGIAQGIDERGYLLLKNELGEINAYSSGEVRIRKQLERI